MNNAPLGITATLELLHRVRDTVREFVSRAETARKAFETRRAALVKAAETGAAERAARMAAQLARAESDRTTALQEAQNRFERRQGRIDQAHKSCLRRAATEVDQEEGRVKYTVQKRSLEAERRRESELANANKVHAEFQQQLADSQDRFAHLEFAAQNAFSPVPEFRRWLLPAQAWPHLEASGDECHLLAELAQLSEQLGRRLDRFRRNPALGVFRVAPIWIVATFALLGYGAALFSIYEHGVRWFTEKQATFALAGTLAAVAVIYWLGKRLGRSHARAIASGLAQAREWHALSLQLADQRRQRETARVQADWEQTTRQLAAQWEQALKEAGRQRAAFPGKIDAKRNRAAARNATLHQANMERLERRFQSELRTIRQQSEGEDTQGQSVGKAALQDLDRDFQAEQEQLRDEWLAAIQPLWEQIRQAQELAQRLCPDWTAPVWPQWTPPTEFARAAKFGRIEVEVEKLAGVVLAKDGLAWPGPARFWVPLWLEFPQQASLLFETGETGREEAIDGINSILFRLLALAPPGKISFTIMDPVGLGQSFAGFMHLADYEGSQINSRIWTQSAQIEEKLAELNEHMEKVIQMYLRNEYPTIVEYNARAGAIAEKYHILIVAGFPVNFSEAAGRRLLNIAASGARCGVFTFIQWDRRRELPHGFVANDLRKSSVVLTATPQGFVLGSRPLPGTHLVLDDPPPGPMATEFLHKVGHESKDANRVELPFAQIAPRPEERWSAGTAEEVRVPIGRTGAAKLQYLAIGKGTRQHALVAGKTGSGKSTLFHVIITNAALWYSPDEVEFYLVDFKKGVEFKCYANRRLPQARVVGIESDREFGLSVLQRVDEELRRRGELFRNAGVQDLTGFRRISQSPLPRVLLLIDEFQEFFTEEDRISQGAAVLLDRLVRQGRAFGVHVVLGSQTLGGAYSLARTTMGQMVIRVALQCNEADAYLIMDENNAAPRLLSRPGEGIYNDMAGALEGNSPFQTAWLSDETRDRCLAEIRQLADRSPTPAPGPLVFEGNAPADPAENQALQDALLRLPAAPPPAPRVWLGAPNSIKGPTEVIFQRQSGQHLLIVGQNDDAGLGLPAICLVALAAQFPLSSLRLILLESTAPGSRERQFLDDLLERLPHPVMRPKRHELATVLSDLAEEILQRTGEEVTAQSPATFLVISSLQELKPLRSEDEFSFSPEPGDSPNPAASFATLMTEGSRKGLHIIASVDTYGNAARFLGRKGLAEFQARVLFQMSASDSASLIDSPDASRLGLHRALLFNEREGFIEKFRPYDLAAGAWLERVAEAFRSRQATGWPSD